MGKAFGCDHELERRAAHQDEIERAVLVVGGEQPVERQEARQERREPQDRRADLLEQRQVRADRERDQRDHDQEEQHADQRAAADPYGYAHVADEDCGEGGHESTSPSRNSRTLSSPMAPWVAAMMRPPSVRCTRIKPARRSWAEASSVLVGSSSSQIGRLTASKRAIDSRRRWPADR